MSRWQFLIYSAAFLAFSFIVPFFFGFLCIVLSAISLGIFLGLLISEHQNRTRRQGRRVRENFSNERSVP